KKYLGDYEGLIRGEIEYDNTEQIGEYKLPDWLSIEITGTILGNDNKLIQLNKTEFLKALKEFNPDER
ncbi:MAG: hypothetical protein LBU87_02305, partial [Lactobacillales bacterium]|nr:hypothetical protein [Lactobacillales bacterium]